MNCVLWFTFYVTLLNAFVGEYTKSITYDTTSSFLYLLIILFYVCVCVCVCLALSFLSKGLVTALEAIIKGKEVPNWKALTTELQQHETLSNIRYHHKIFQCAQKKSKIRSCYARMTHVAKEVTWKPHYSGFLCTIINDEEALWSGRKRYNLF